VKIAASSGINIKVFQDYDDYCCGMAFDSQGYKDTGNEMKHKLIDRLMDESDSGKIPIVLDMSPCTQFLQNTDSNLEFIDSVQFLSILKEKLEFNPIDDSIYVHPVCSSQKMGTADDIISLAKLCSQSIETTLEPFCCGTGGDRSIQFPELPKNTVNQSLKGITSSKGISSSRTCELGLSESTEIEFSSIESLVYRAIKK
jgi:D-lactate dehydrogenase